MRILPADTAVLLVGPRVAHLAPHFAGRGFQVEACTTGEEALKALDARLRDLVVLELKLGEVSLQDVVATCARIQPQAAILLLDDASRAGQIVKAIQAGVHGYLATPPDEAQLFSEVERQVLAARARSGALARGFEAEIDRLRAEAGAARKEALEAEMRVDLLGQELSAVKEELEALRKDAAVVEELKAERDRLKDDLGTVTAERDELKEALGAARARLSEATELNVKHATLMMEVEDLRGKAEAYDEERARAEALKDALENIKRRLRETEALSDERAERIAALEQELAAARRDHDEAAGQIGALCARIEALEREVEATRAERERAEEKALEWELVVDEIKTKTEFLEEQLKEAKERADKAEAHFKKERLRLIEEKQKAAAGSHEAYQKMEKLVDDLQALRQAKLEAEARIRELEEALRARTGGVKAGA